MLYHSNLINYSNNIIPNNSSSNNNISNNKNVTLTNYNMYILALSLYSIFTILEYIVLNTHNT